MTTCRREREKEREKDREREGEREREKERERQWEGERGATHVGGVVRNKRLTETFLMCQRRQNFPCLPDRKKQMVRRVGGLYKRKALRAHGKVDVFL